jgi:hypothetical protein
MGLAIVSWFLLVVIATLLPIWTVHFGHPVLGTIQSPSWNAFAQIHEDYEELGWTWLLLELQLENYFLAGEVALGATLISIFIYWWANCMFRVGTNVTGSPHALSHDLPAKATGPACRPAGGWCRASHERPIPLEAQTGASSLA